MISKKLEHGHVLHTRHPTGVSVNMDAKVQARRTQAHKVTES
jgi:hypothetical protein